MSDEGFEGEEDYCSDQWSDDVAGHVCERKIDHLGKCRCSCQATFDNPERERLRLRRLIAESQEEGL